MVRKRRWSDEELRQAVASGRSTAQVLQALGLRPLGGNYPPVQQRIKDLGLSTAHWTRQAYLKGKTNPHVPKRPLKDILRKGSDYQSNKLRKRLIKEGLIEAKCAECGSVQWRGQPMPLELDHMDGDRTNNTLGNLRLICPNCHALTATYRGRNTRYAHIPSLAEIRTGIERLGSIAAYARARGVSQAAVRGWMRSERLRRSYR